MLWLKRNLFLAVGGLVALLLLVAGVVYSVLSYGSNKKVEEELGERRSQLDKLIRADPSPSPANIELAKLERTNVQAAIKQAAAQFAPLPTRRYTNASFSTDLARALAQLRTLAQNRNVALPDKDYAFTFSAQAGLLLPVPLPEALVEVEELSRVLFEARISKLNRISRSRLSTNDVGGSFDYLPYGRTNAPNNTNFLICRYLLDFNCLGAELATVLKELARLPYGVCVKAVQIEPAAQVAAGGITPAAAMSPAPPPGGPPPPDRAPPPRGGRFDRFAPQGPGGRPPPGRPPPSSSAPGAYQAAKSLKVLDQKQLRAVIFLELTYPRA
jgi:hypothetical protein